MARPKTATAILDARGAFKKDPQRKRNDEPVVSEGLDTTPPEHLTHEQVSRWVEIIKIAPAGVITSADLLAVEALAIMWAEFREKTTDYPVSKLGRMMQIMSKLGLDPSGRAGLVVEKSKTNKFDD